MLYQFNILDACLTLNESAIINRITSTFSHFENLGTRETCVDFF